MIPYTGSSPFLRVVSAPQWNFFLIEPEPEKYDRKYCCFFGLWALVYLDKPVCLSNNITHYTDALSLQIKKDVHNGKCLLILDLSNEGHIEPNNVYHIKLLEDLIASLDPADNSILFLDQNRRITKTFGANENFNKLRHKIKFLNYNFHHKLLINDVFVSSNIEFSSDRFFPSFESFFDHKQKVLLALLGTPRPHRVVLYHYLRHRSYKNNSLVSFVGFETTKGKDTKEYSLNFLKVNPLGRYLDEKLNQEKIEEIINSLPSEHLDTDMVQDLNLLATHIPFELYKQSFFSVVSETEFSDGNMNRITEKTLKSFAMGHPSIIFGNPDSLDLVRELGFQLFEDVINPKYDQVIDPLQRFEAILDTIEETVNYVTTKPKIFAELIYERSKYNFLHAVVGLKTRYEELMEYPILEYITEWLSKEN
jgi:hypothetical protein